MIRGHPAMQACFGRRDQVPGVAHPTMGRRFRDTVRARTRHHRHLKGETLSCRSSPFTPLGGDDQ
eukprot:6464584-Amphidinium_carterae.1